MDKTTYSMSTEDIFKAANRVCNFVTYPEIADYDDIDDLFELGEAAQRIQARLGLPADTGAVLILYMSKPSYGHWCVLTKIDGDKPTYNFLDSYGGVIDSQRMGIPDDFRKESGQDKPLILRLLADEDNPVYYNGKTLQKVDGETATCGRYASLYIRYNQTPVDDFVKVIEDFSSEYDIDPDDVVTIVTNEFMEEPQAGEDSESDIDYDELVRNFALEHDFDPEDIDYGSDGEYYEF